MLLLLPLSRLLGLDPSMAGFGPGMLLERGIYDSVPLVQVFELTEQNELLDRYGINPLGDIHALSSPLSHSTPFHIQLERLSRAAA